MLTLRHLVPSFFTPLFVSELFTALRSIPTHANPTHTSGEVRSPDSNITPLPAQLSAAKSYAKELLASATALAPKEWEGTSEYPYLVATLVQVMHGKISGERIAAQEEEKIKAYGNKKW